MSLVDTTPHIVLISLLLKCIFILVIAVELMLPRWKKYPLLISWKTDWKEELQHSLIEGGAFFFSIGLLLVFDIIASDESWLMLPVTLFLDILLILMILSLLFSPKTYGITEKGIYCQGLTLRWEHILKFEHSKKKLQIRTRGTFRENRTFPLPLSEDERKEIVRMVQDKMEKADKKK